MPNPLTHDLPFEHADLRLTSLADMPLEMLLVAMERSITDGAPLA